MAYASTKHSINHGWCTNLLNTNKMKNLVKNPRLFLKAGIIGMFVVTMSIVGMSTSSATMNPSCPNGCLDQCGRCFCYEFYHLKEASWEVEEEEAK